jgi:bla regulator protein BlaR1
MEWLVQTLLSNAVVATILAVAAALLGRTCRRPALTHSLWLVVMLKLITPPLVLVSVPVTAVSTQPESHPAISSVDPGAGQAAQAEMLAELRADARAARHFDAMTSAASPKLARTEPELATPDGDPRSIDQPDEKINSALTALAGLKWEHVALIVVLSGAVGWWALAMVRIIRFQRALRGVQRVAGDWQARTDELAGHLGLRRAPVVCMVPGQVPPMLWAIGGRPRLLVPSQLWPAMSPDERTSLLLHELAHLKRRDHWVRWLELIVAGLYWWHPVVWWARRALREAEEQCCDAWVVWAMPQGARTYAAALMTALEFVSGARIAPAVASAIGTSGDVSCLKRRLRMIVGAKTPKGLSWTGRLAVLGMAALLLPLAPSWAQNKLTPAGADHLSDLAELNRPARTQPGQTLDQQANPTIEGGVAEEFKKDPEVIALTREIVTARDRLEHSAIANRELTESLTQQRAKLQAEIGARRERLKDLIKKGPIVVLGPLEISAQPKLQKLSEAQIHQMLSEMVQTDVELIEAQATLDAKLASNQASKEEKDQLGLKVKQLAEKNKEQKALFDEIQQKVTNDKVTYDHAFEAISLEYQIRKLMNREDQIKRNLEQLKFEASLDKNRAVSDDPVWLVAQKRLGELEQQYEDLWNSKYGKLLARLTEIQDGDKKDDIEDKLRDSAERFQEQVKDLIEKLGKELGPVGEEVRKALKRAVGEVHKSLEKEQFSAEDLGKALEKSGDELRKAFEGGGRVDKELREAIDRSREEIQGALDRAKESAKDQVDALRDSARELTDQDRSDRERSRRDAREGSAQEDASRLNRQELENARREIRDLEQQLRRATRRMEELERRATRRNPAPRREPTPRPAPSPTPPAPRVEPVLPQPPRGPVAPARPARPAPPSARRAQPPGRVGPGGARRAPEADSDRRLKELEDKMDRLLKELKSLKDENSPRDERKSSSRDARPNKLDSAVVL